MTGLFGGFFQGDDVAIPDEFCFTPGVFFTDAAAKGVVIVLRCALGCLHFTQAVKAVPAQLGDLFPALFLGQIAACVVFKVGACILFQQVIQQFWGLAGQGVFGLACRVEQIAGRIKSEGFLILWRVGGEQPAYRIVAVLSLALIAVFNAQQLPNRIVLIAAVATGFAAERLLQHAAHRVVLGMGLQLIAQLAAGFAVKFIALKAGDFLFIPQHAVHMAAAVNQPVGALAVGADAGDAVAQLVVFVRPVVLLLLAKQAVVVLLADQIANGIEAKAAFAVLVFSGVNPANRIIFKALTALAAAALA